MILYDWAIKWGVPLEAIKDLEARLYGPPPTGGGAESGRSEAAVQSRIRMEAARKGAYLWRNNVGACVDEHGNHIRYGLANDSQKLNRVFKSSDLIGIRPVTILPQHVGQQIGQFVAREIKAEDWSYSATDRERAQRAFIDLVVGLGGDAQFASREGTL